MVNKIKTLKNLNKKFPRFQLETLLTIIDCIEDEVAIFPVNKSNSTFEPPFKVTCSNKVTTDQYRPDCTLTAQGEPLNESYTYCKYSETTNNNGEETTNEIVATDDNGDVHVYVNGDECGMEFPPKSKKQPHLCDKTSCKVNILTEADELFNKFIEDNLLCDE